MIQKTPTTTSSSHGTERAADNLFRIFEEMIRTGALKEGDTLPPEREIVGTYGVSRTVVRETVLALANKGLVEAKPRFRPVVRKPSFEAAIGTIDSVVGQLLSQPDGVKNLFETRIMVEAALVRQAATDADKDDIARLRQALAENEAAIEDSELFYQTDTRFHATLYEISKNPVLPAVHKAYTAWLAPQWSRMPRLPDRNRSNYEAHKAILDAILLRDPDAAEAALRGHLDAAWLQVRATFGDI
ncbi:MAG: FCD domain-containing protein [Shimia sp.]|nr:FCD domain-containing protein [Shimia sp.]